LSKPDRTPDLRNNRFKLLNVATPSSIPAFLSKNAIHDESRPAISSEDGCCLSHGELWRQASRVVDQINALGVGRGDRIAMVLPQGPVPAVAFLAIACAATAAPLNPGYLEKEFAFYLEDLQARALILMKGQASPARSAATALGVPVIELALRPNGSFDLSGTLDAGTPGAGAALPGLAEADDVALVLHTSGTTSRPKMVPLTQKNLCASARNIGSTLELSESDLCLNVMPLFHIHGLVACVLASLAAGGGTICTTGFNADDFPGWLQTWKPTWYSAVPTMHQAILAHLQGQGQSTIESSLRFIRSSSAALPPSVMMGLENLFQVPVIESYGMTEAAHQMASNPLPPRLRKPGCVGLPAGPEIAILDEAGNQMEAGTTGEIAIRGENVTPGYHGNPEANAQAFQRGWLRTGDQGFFDADGYLFITGRLKEMINRGGEKLAPREVDETLLAHPMVRQAVAFAVPHPSLGEDVVAAVVLHPGADCTEADLRGFVLDRLPAFKAPSRIIVVPDIPRGSTGKIQRIGLARQLGAFLATAYEEPASPMEKRVVDMFIDVLGCPPAGRQGNFFMLGGDSLRATQVLTRLGRSLSLELPTPLLFRMPTPALLATELERSQAEKELDDLAKALEQLSAEERAKLLD
jgi:acyl-CoA synthetase (AMP-forming)/AMP-acid ligase II